MTCSACSRNPREAIFPGAESFRSDLTARSDRRGCWAGSSPRWSARDPVDTFFDLSTWLAAVVGARDPCGSRRGSASAAQPSSEPVGSRGARRSGARPPRSRARTRRARGNVEAVDGECRAGFESAPRRPDYMLQTTAGLSRADRRTGSGSSSPRVRRPRLSRARRHPGGPRPRILRSRLRAAGNRASSREPTPRATGRPVCGRLRQPRDDRDECSREGSARPPRRGARPALPTRLGRPGCRGCSGRERRCRRPRDAEVPRTVLAQPETPALQLGRVERRCGLDRGDELGPRGLRAPGGWRWGRSSRSPAGPRGTVRALASSRSLSGHRALRIADLEQPDLAEVDVGERVADEGWAPRRAGRRRQAAEGAARARGRAP
jgi:hypothetical protein